MNDTTINTHQDPEQQPTTPTPEASGGQGSEKLFTQADLDRIIGDRLARERAKAEPSPEDTREADLRAREARLDCREFISAEGYPTALLELFDTTDAAKFKATVEKLDSIVDLPSNHRRPVPRFVTGSGSGGGHGAPGDRSATLLEEAFKPPKI